MRKIKFRAWDKVFKKIIEDIEYAENVKNNDALIIMQFTGLKDKNGKEIYEGDVVKSKSDDRIWVVKYTKGAWEMWLEGIIDVRRNLTSHNLKMEVIGNIYENPKLLEEEKKNG